MSVANVNLAEAKLLLVQAQLNKTQAEIQGASAKYEFQIQTAVPNYELGSLP